MSQGEPVPQPPLKPHIGNLAELDADAPIQSFMRLAKTYGPFFKLKIIDREMYLACSQALVNELCDETRFRKRIHAPLREIRAFAGDGLFTAHNSEPNWGKAHRMTRIKNLCNLWINVLEEKWQLLFLAVSTWI